MKEALLKKFGEVYGDAQGVKVFFAPGRVNLIGEHTDEILKTLAGIREEELAVFREKGVI